MTDDKWEPRCCLCGRDLTQPGASMMVPVNIETRKFVRDDDDPAYDQGIVRLFDVGQECFKKYSAIIDG